MATIYLTHHWKVTEFDQAVRQLVDPEAVRKREEERKRKRVKKRSKVRR